EERPPLCAAGEPRQLRHERSISHAWISDRSFPLTVSQEMKSEDRPAHGAGRGAGVAAVRCTESGKGSRQGRASIFHLAAERRYYQGRLLVSFRPAQHGYHPCRRELSEQRSSSFADRCE